MKNVSLTRLDHRRDHHGIAQPTDWLLNHTALHLRFPALCRPFEQHSTIHIIRQEEWLGGRYPGRIRYMGHLCEICAPEFPPPTTSTRLPENDCGST